MIQDFNRFKRRAGLWLALWMGGLIVGAVLVALGAVANSVSLARIGLACFGVAMLAEAAVRALLYKAAAKLRAYSWFFVGLRGLASLVLLYLAAGFHL